MSWRLTRSEAERRVRLDPGRKFPCEALHVALGADADLADVAVAIGLDEHEVVRRWRR